MKPSIQLTLLAAAAAVVATACGGDDAPPVTEPPPYEERALRLIVPAELDVGAPLPLSWTVTNTAPGDRLIMRMRAPGDPIQRTLAGYHDSGSVPATIVAGWIGPDGAVAATEVTLSDTGADGQVAVTLPSAATGDWAVDAMWLREDVVLATATATTWVAAGPAVRLELSRSWASAESVVRARVRVRGTGTADVRLSAFLTEPDGTIRTLPGRGDEYVPVAEGVLASAEHVLLADRIGEAGEGEYLVTVRLETVAGATLAQAGAVVQVCGATGTISGTVATAAGAPVGDGMVTAISTVPGALESVSAEVSAAGTFTIEVPAGRFALVASGASGGGAGVVEVGCGQSVTTAIEAVATASARVPPAPGPRSTRPAPTATSAPGLLARARKPILLNVSGDGTPAADRLSRELTYRLRNSTYAAGLNFWTHTDLGEALQIEMARQLTGTDTGETAGQLNKASDAHFVVAVTTQRIGQVYVVAARIVDPRTLRNVRAAQVSTEDLEVSASAKLPELADALLEPGIASELRGLYGLEHPHVDLVIDRPNPAPGETVTATVVLTDGDPAEPIGDHEVITRVTPAGAQLIEQVVTTGLDGVARFTYTVPATGPLPQRVEFSARVEVTPTVSEPASPKLAVPVPSANANARQEPNILRSGGQVARVLLRGNARLARTGFAVLTNLNRLAPSAVRLDENHLADFDVETLASEGPSRVVASFLVNDNFFGVPTMSSMVVNGYVLAPVTIQAFLDPGNTTINGGHLSIRGRVFRDGEPYPDIAVAFTVDGEGRASAGAFTDEDGGFTALFLAPAAGTGTSTVTARVVAEAGSAELALTVGYGPQCGGCALVVLPNSQPVNVRKGRTQLFVANQEVTWAATAGQITAGGVFTADDVGGVVHVTATSVQSPGMSVTVPVVVECTRDEMLGTFSGPWTQQTGVAEFPFNCATALLVLAPISSGNTNVDFQANRACGTETSSTYVNYTYPGQGCSILRSYREVGVCVGDLERIFLRPDLTMPGRMKWIADVNQARVPSGPLGQSCEQFFTGTASLTRP